MGPRGRARECFNGGPPAADTTGGLFVLVAPVLPGRLPENILVAPGTPRKP